MFPAAERVHRSGVSPPEFPRRGRGGRSKPSSDGGPGRLGLAGLGQPAPDRPDPLTRPSEVTGYCPPRQGLPKLALRTWACNGCEADGERVDRVRKGRGPQECDDPGNALMAAAGLPAPWVERPVLASQRPFRRTQSAHPEPDDPLIMTAIINSCPGRITERRGP